MLLYELLTGTTPFDRETLRPGGLRRDAADHPRGGAADAEHAAGRAGGDARGRLGQPAQPTRGGWAEPMRGELDWIVMKALEKDRTRRYETANDFAADVMRHLTDQPVEACPPSARYRFAKFARRNRAALTTAAWSRLALVVGTAVSAWQAVRATRPSGGPRPATTGPPGRRRDVHAGRREVAGAEAELTPLQREFLEKALAFYEQFAARTAGTDPGAVRGRPGPDRAGRIEVKLGKFDQATGSFRRTIDQLEELAATFPRPGRIPA